MNIVKCIAWCEAAALLFSMCGCTAVKHYKPDEGEEAYSRVLYVDDTENDEQLEAEKTDDENEDNEKTSHESEKENDGNNKSDKDKEKKEKDDKKDNKNDSINNDNSSFASSSKKESSAAISSKKSEAARAAVSAKPNYDKSESRSSSRAASSSSKSSDTDTDSQSDTDTDTSTDIILFTEDDLKYNAKNQYGDYIEFGDDEYFVIAIMGEPKESSLSEDGTILTYVYDESIMMFKNASEEDDFMLYDIVVPYSSYYETTKGISTEHYARYLFRAYGEPMRVVPYYYAEKSTDTITDIDTDININTDIDTDSEIAADTDTDDIESAADNPEKIIVEPSGDDYEPAPNASLYYYVIDDKMLIFTIKQKEIMQIEYRWDI